MKRLIPLVLTIALVAAACGDDSSSTDAGGPGDGGSATTTTVATTTTLDPDTPAGALAAARERWAENGLASYRLATTEICFCPETGWVNTIVDGVVVTHEPADDESFFDPGPRSMETLFDEIAAVIDAGYETLDVEYHPETGAVISYYVDVDAMMADEEHGVRVTSLTPYDPEAPAVTVEAAALIDDYGCGYGFAKGNPEQTLGLIIYFEGEYVPGGPDVTTPIELPSDDWYAAVQTGSDLFANWCDDVIEIDEPTPIVDETWEVAGGTLTVTPPTPADCAGDVVTATLVGAVAESADGTQIPLDDIALTNTGWGCFAG
ncbi:MAG: DUF6174 domain-containing protein [Acidimicrobiales bacterium]